MVAIHFLSPWYETLWLPGCTTSSIYLYVSMGHRQMKCGSFSLERASSCKISRRQVLRYWRPTSMELISARESRPALLCNGLDCLISEATIAHLQMATARHCMKCVYILLSRKLSALKLNLKVDLHSVPLGPREVCWWYTQESGRRNSMTGGKVIVCCYIYMLHRRTRNISCGEFRLLSLRTASSDSRATQMLSQFLNMVEMENDFVSATFINCRGIFKVRTSVVQETSVFVSPEGLDTEPTTLTQRGGWEGYCPHQDSNTQPVWSRVHCFDYASSSNIGKNPQMGFVFSEPLLTFETVVIIKPTGWGFDSRPWQWKCTSNTSYRCSYHALIRLI